MLQNLTMVVGLVPDTGVYGEDEDCAYEEANDESDEDVDDECNRDVDVQADRHVSSFQIFNQVLENEQRYMSLPMQHLVTYRITQMLRNQMSHPLFIITY